MKPYSLKVETLDTPRFRGIRAVAKIRPCKKRGIKIKAQKTYRMSTVAPTFTKEEVLPAIEAQFDRWAQKKLSTTNAL